MTSNHTLKGFLYGAAAAASYGLNPLFTLPLYSKGIGADSVLFYRYFLALVMMGVMMKVQHIPFSLRKVELLPLFAMGLFFSFSSLTLFMSYNYMDAGIASTILFVYPVLVAVLMALFFKEKVSLITTASILLAVTGISLLYRGEGGQTLSTLGIVLVFTSSLTYAMYIIGVNRSVLKEMNVTKLTFYVLLSGLSIYLVRLRFGLDLDWIEQPMMWGNPIGLALFPTIISLITMTKSIHYIGSTSAAILGALEPITALFIGVAVFGEQLTPRIMVGVFLILLAVTLIIAGKSVVKAVKLRLFHRY